MERSIDSTLRLLLSSAPVGISGGFRVFIGFLLAGITPVIRPCIASALVIYAVYLLDRTIPCPEDRINQQKSWWADRKTGMAGFVIAYLAGTSIFLMDGLYLVPLLPLIAGILYTKGVSIAGRSYKLKGGAGLKNLVIGLVWGGSIALVVAHWAGGITAPLCIFLFFGAKLFINSTIFDIKDIEGDLSAGIRTIPAVLGPRHTQFLLALCSLLLHLLMAFLVFRGYVQPESIILGYSALIGVIFVLLYRADWELERRGVKRYLRQLFIDGESGFSLVLRFFSGVLRAAIVPGSM